MRKKALYSVAALALSGILLAATPRAQEPKADRAADKAAVEQTVRDYIAAFIAGDPKKIATYFNVPVMLVGSGKVLGTRSEIEEWGSEVRGDLQSLGYGIAVINQLAVKLLGQDVAFLSVSGQRRRRDGTFLDEVGYSVFLRRTDTGWKIAAFATHPAADFIKLE